MVLLDDRGKVFPGSIQLRMTARNRHIDLVPWFLLMLCSATYCPGCSDDYRIVGVGSSGPGIVAVYIEPDDADSMIVIAGDTVKPTSSDSLALSVSQGRAFRGVDYAILYKSLQDYLQSTEIYNAIHKEGGKYQTLLAFQSYLPPANYDSLTFILSADYLQIGFYQIPLSAAQAGNDFVTVSQGFHIDEGKTTTITLKLKPFVSLTRVGDSYQYSWVFGSLQITYQ